MDKCENCDAGLLSVSDICPQCGWLKNKRIESEVEEKVEDDIKSEPPTQEPTVSKSKIYRPTGVRLFGIFYLVFGIVLVIFGIVFGASIMLLVLMGGMSGFDEIGDLVMELHETAGVSTGSEIKELIRASDAKNIGVVMDTMMEAMGIMFVESVLGIVAFVVGRGLFRGKKWAWIVAMVSAIISIPLAVLLLDEPDNVVLLGMGVFDGLLLYYMRRPKVKEYFTQNSIKKPKVKKSKIKKKKD